VLSTVRAEARRVEEDCSPAGPVRGPVGMTSPVSLSETSISPQGPEASRLPVHPAPRGMNRIGRGFLFRDGKGKVRRR